jgi:hypothetical protein
MRRRLPCGRSWHRGESRCYFQLFNLFGGQGRRRRRNRVLRGAGLLRAKDELGREQLDAGGSEAFAVADHEVARVCVQRPERIAEVRELFERVGGIEVVLDEKGSGRPARPSACPGEPVAVSRAGQWFAYYHRFDDDRALDWARTASRPRRRHAEAERKDSPRARGPAGIGCSGRSGRSRAPI